MEGFSTSNRRSMKKKLDFYVANPRARKIGLSRLNGNLWNMKIFLKIIIFDVEKRYMHLNNWKGRVDGG